MIIEGTSLTDVFIINSNIYEDNRGLFQETWNEEKLSKLLKKKIKFVQDNHSESKINVIRGLHYQHSKPQGKLVKVFYGKILDVVVDLRQKSPTFGKHIKCILSAKNNKQLWVPEGFAHGFLTLEKVNHVFYKVTDYYDPDDQNCIKWDDISLNIDWEINNFNPILSEKDQGGILFNNAKLF
jgi:dTDP-4-dehydrorhamnose 3,5-epimerase